MISIVVPVYNEEKVLPSFIAAFFKEIDLSEKYELIFVNDGSSDSTESIVKKAMKKNKTIRLVSYSPNKNLGYALPAGFRAAKGRVVVTMDSDLAHPPRVISKLVKRLDEGHDIVIGSRYLPGAGIDGVPFASDFLSKLTNIVTKLVIMTKIKDVTTGFRAYNKEFMQKIRTREKGFEVELELLVKSIKNKAKFSEVPFNSVDRSAGESKFKLVEHGPRYVKGMFRIFLYRWLQRN